jgi:selenocysteine-specific elongation factor
MSETSSHHTPAVECMAASVSPHPDGTTQATTECDDDNISSILNINVGVLGHVDSGKTSLVKAMSTLLSTASLDKSTQSRQRGMTLDLGFSCFFVDTVPQRIRDKFPHKKRLQITLVDCPGHASLIRTIIGGAQIIDIVLLVVDAVKGWQAQTTECLVLAELCTSHMIIALNKIDAIPIQERAHKIKVVQEQIEQMHLKRTRFATTPHNVSTTPMIGVSACVGGEKVAAVNVNEAPHSHHTNHTNSTSIGHQEETVPTNGVTTAITPQHYETMNIDVLISTLIEHVPTPHRNCNQSITNSNTNTNTAFYFAIDHCFPIRGRGTVITGTCLSGRISVNDTIEFPTVAVQRKVKSIQMFKRSVSTMIQGDRAGICVSHFDANLIERSIAAAPPGTVQLWKGAIAIVRKVPYYPTKLGSNSKFHISVGHTTVMATVSFWGARELASSSSSSTIDPERQNTPTLNAATSSIRNLKKNVTDTLNIESFGGSADMAGLPHMPYDYNQDFVYQEEFIDALEGENDESKTDQLLNWAIIDFQTPIHCPLHCLIIGSRLDMVDNATKAASSCRLAFSGRLIERIDPDNDSKKIRLYNTKEKVAVVAKLGDPYKRTDDEKTVRYEVYGSDLFKKETNMKLFIGMKLTTKFGEVGEIKSSFGTDGNFRVYFPAGTETKEGDSLGLQYKRFINDATKAMHQDLTLPAARSGSRIEVVAKKKSKKTQPGVNKYGLVDAIKGDILENGKHCVAIISGLFAPEINVKERAGGIVVIPRTGECGTILGPFGKAGKCKVAFNDGISANVGDKVELRL